MLSRFYTRDTRTTILEELQETVSRTMRTLNTVRNGNAVANVTVLPAVIEIENPDGSGTGNFIVTATGSPVFLDFLKAQFNVEMTKKGGLSSSWKIVIKRPIRIAPTASVARAATRDEEGNTSVVSMGSIAHPTTARFATSDANAARATKNARILETFMAKPTKRQIEDVMTVLNLDEPLKARLRLSKDTHLSTVTEILKRFIHDKLAKQGAGAGLAAAAFAGATGSMDPEALASAARSANAATAALNVHARALRNTNRHIITPEEMAQLTEPEGGAGSGGYRRTKRRKAASRKTKRRQTKRHKTKNRRTH